MPFKPAKAKPAIFRQHCEFIPPHLVPSIQRVGPTSSTVAGFRIGRGLTPKLSVGRFTASSIDGPFEWCGNVGQGHPDPDIMFAEGRFYLATQTPKDFVSPGPWVETVEVRVGVDTNKDAKIDQWSDWQVVKEHYDYTPGFAKQVQKTSAAMDLSALPPGYGFQFEVRLTDTTANPSKPILDKVVLSFTK